MELGRWNVCACSNDTHGSGVARTSLDLLSIRDGEVGNRGTEVDEVVRRREGGNLSCCWSTKPPKILSICYMSDNENRILVLSVVLKAFGNYRVQQGEGRLGIPIP